MQQFEHWFQSKFCFVIFLLHNGNTGNNEIFLFPIMHCWLLLILNTIFQKQKWISHWFHPTWCIPYCPHSTSNKHDISKSFSLIKCIDLLGVSIDPASSYIVFLGTSDLHCCFSLLSIIYRSTEASYWTAVSAVRYQNAEKCICTVYV